MKESFLVVFGAREHNLKNIDITIPHNTITVFTGLSGSGKSSLAFDTIYAEGQRRYMETFSTYARQFIGSLKRPNVDKITGLSPVIAIEQKTVTKNPRSTVGTITEIYDYLRLLYARIAEPYSYETGEKMVKYTEEQILSLIYQNFLNKTISIFSPIIRGRKGHYKELFEQLRNKGFLYVRVNKEQIFLKPGLSLDRYKTHFIDLFIDQLTVNEKNFRRLKQSLTLGLKQSKGNVLIIDDETKQEKYFSKNFYVSNDGIVISRPSTSYFFL